MNPTLISVFSATAAAAWSIWTWKSERQKERELKRDEMSAQYVNSLLITAQELQRLLYKILDEDELARYRQENPEPCEPASPAAINLLCHFSQFFGWMLMTYRFGPYTRNPRMISIMTHIGETLESRSRYSGEAFRFTIGDRHALGLAALRRVGESSGKPSFIALTRFEFEQEMIDAQGARARLFRSKAVRSTLVAIDRADRPEMLEGHERLAVLQNLLLDLLSYLEKEEGFHVNFGERGRAGLKEKQTGVQSQSMDVRILHQMPGRIRLRIPGLPADNACASRLQSIQSLNHVRSVRFNAYAASLVVEYEAEVPLAEILPAVLAIIENL